MGCQQLLPTPGVTLGLIPEIDPADCVPGAGAPGPDMMMGTPLCVLVPPGVVPSPALPGTEPGVEEPHGLPEPGTPVVLVRGALMPGEIIVLWPTGRPDGYVGVVGVVSVPCAHTGVENSIAAARERDFIRFPLIA